MARQRMVTRAMDITTAEIMCLNISTAEVSTQQITMTGIYNDSDLLKVAKKQIETESLKAVHIVSSTVSQKLYGMLETEFLKLAKELDDKRKFVE